MNYAPRSTSQTSNSALCLNIRIMDRFVLQSIIRRVVRSMQSMTLEADVEIIHMDEAKDRCGIRHRHCPLVSSKNTLAQRQIP